jgi:hypothetical protein
VNPFGAFGGFFASLVVMRLEKGVAVDDIGGASFSLLLLLLLWLL